MTKPDGVVGNEEGREVQPVSEADGEANAVTIADEEALEQAC